MIDLSILFGELELAFISRIRNGLSRYSLIEQAKIAETLNFFDELNAAGFQDTLSKIDSEYLLIINDLRKQRESDFTTITEQELQVLIDDDLRPILRSGEAYAEQFKARLIKGFALGEGVKEMFSDFSIPGFKYNWQVAARTTAIDEFHSVSTAKIYEDDPNQRFYLSHPIDARTRPECKAVHKYQPKEGFTFKQVKDGLLTNLAKQHYLEFTRKPYKDESTLVYNWRMRGGFNCRGRIEPK